MKRFLYTLSFLLIAGGLFAQDLTDALRYSNYRITGTARAAAMGNAFGALGGDFTSLSINPAGAAVYRSGEFTITPSIGNFSSDGTYLGTTVNDSKYHVALNNIGYIAAIPTGSNSESGLVGLTFGVGFNRLADFSRTMMAQGSNAKSSLLTYFTNNMNNDFLYYKNAEDQNLDAYYEKLAWDTYLINRDDNTNEYFNDITDNGYGQSVRKTTNQTGYINEYLLSFAANFNHKFYIGATLGIHDVYYKEDASIYEWDANNNIPYFNNFTFNTYLKTTGTGYNLKIGAILKPTNSLRLGVAIHTPTFYKFSDLYNNNMSSSITYLSDGATEITSTHPDKAGVYDYEIQTPLRAVFSGAYVIGKKGLISVDYEVLNYSTAKIRNGSDGYNYASENATIGQVYRSVGNLHLGGEYRVNNFFSLRAGYENYPSALRSSYDNGMKNNYSTISGGFGFNQGGFFLDAAYKHAMGDNYLKLYPDQNATEMVKYSNSLNNVILTLGYKF